MQTPIVIVSQGPREIYFYDEREYHKYVRENASKAFTKKYLKGLASNNKENVEMSFGRKMIEFIHDEKAAITLSHTFDTKKVNTDFRKNWIANYDPNNVVLTWEDDEPETKNLSITDFLNTEMIKHSIDNCNRTIPSCIDGFKESQRKALYGTILRKLNYNAKKTIRVFQLVGSITEKTGYHHGNKSMEDTVIGMASYYIGGNNIPLFFRDGQFGSRMDGGKDAGHPRYILTKLDRLTRLIFRPEDDVLLTYVESEGEKYEPEYFVPIIPMVLVNGSVGIGTGWSSFIPCYDPTVLCDAIRGWLGSEKKIQITNEDGSVLRFIPELVPWYHDHKGDITYDEKQRRYLSWGISERNGNKIHITELPVGTWTNSFKEKLNLTMEGDAPGRIFFGSLEKQAQKLTEQVIDLFFFEGC
jgi:DNA topoisomerase-2